MVPHVPESVAWTQSDSTIATLGATPASTNSVLAKLPGSTVITVTLSGITANTTLYVIDASLVSMTIATDLPNNISGGTLAKGLTQQFVATGTYSDTQTAVITEQVVWNSSLPGVASISATGLATALSNGTTFISATMFGITCSPTYSLTVSNKVFTSMTIRPGNATVVNGTTLNLYAVAHYSDGSNSDNGSGPDSTSRITQSTGSQERLLVNTRFVLLSFSRPDSAEVTFLVSKGTAVVKYLPAGLAPLLMFM